MTYSAGVAAEWGRKVFPEEEVKHRVALLAEAGSDSQRMAETMLDQLRPGAT